MLCERCHKNQATAVLTQTVNGRTTTEHLCAECAYMNGITGLFNGFPFSQMMSNLEKVNGTSGKRCPKCGASLDEIIETGRIGCSECYRVFRAELMPTIQNIHGKATHVGKRPQAFKKEIPEKTRMEQLRDDLQTAIQQENFENAAKLRDQIRDLSAENSDGTQQDVGPERT